MANQHGRILQRNVGRRLEDARSSEEFLEDASLIERKLLLYDPTPSYSFLLLTLLLLPAPSYSLPLLLLSLLPFAAATSSLLRQHNRIHFDFGLPLALLSNLPQNLPNTR